MSFFFVQKEGEEEVENSIFQNNVGRHRERHNGNGTTTDPPYCSQEAYLHPPPNTLIYSAVLCPHWPGLLLSWSLHLLFSCPLHRTGSLSSRPSLSDFLVPPWLYSELCSVCLCSIVQAPLNAVVHTVRADSKGMPGQAGGALTSFFFLFVCAIYVRLCILPVRQCVL